MSSKTEMSWSFDSTSNPTGKAAGSIQTKSRRNRLGPLNRAETETLVVSATIVLSTAFDASRLAAENFDTGQNCCAFRAGIKKFPCHAAPLEREFMATRLVGNTEIGASLMPFLAVSFDTLATNTVLGQEVSQLMTQCSLNFGSGNLEELGIQNNHSITPYGQAGCRAKAGIPENTHLEMPTPDRLQELICKILQQGIMAQAGLSPWSRYIIWRSANTPHDGASKIHDELLVFHAANAG